MAKKIDIALCVPHHLTFYREILCGALDYASLHTDIVLHHTPNDVYSSIANHKFDGVIDFIYKDKEYEFLEKHQLPYVNLSQAPDHIKCPTVTLDNYCFGAECARHLIAHGIKNMIMVIEGRFPYTEHRLQGINDELNKVAGHCEEVIINSTDTSFTNSSWGLFPDIFEPILKKYDSPIGVICQSSTQACSVIGAAHLLNRQCPEDVAVISCTEDNIIGRLSTPQITCLEQSGETVGYQAMDLLHQLILKKDVAKKQRLIPPKGIIKRGSAERKTEKSDLVLQLDAVISERFRENITVADVVRYFKLSRRSLEQRFRDETGYTIYESIQHYCYKEAQNLLNHTDLSIKEVAYKSGFGSDQVMRKYFNQKLGITPIQYRLKQ